MRKLVIFLHTSLDGMVEGPKGAMDISFIRYNDELEAFADSITAKADTIVWGSKTYEMMFHYWPDMRTNPEANNHEKQHADWIENVEKVICSSSLNKVTWNNSLLIKEDITANIKSLKQKEGKDILVLGSPRLAKFLLSEKLVDEIKLTISPVILGSGLSLFENFTSSLTLLEEKTFSTGTLGLTYQVN